MIIGEYNFTIGQQFKKQSEIDEDTNIIVAHHGLYFIFIIYSPVSSLSKNKNSTT